jgi:hypothetical protein
MGFLCNLRKLMDIVTYLNPCGFVLKVVVFNLHGMMLIMIQDQEVSIQRSFLSFWTPKRP